MAVLTYVLVAGLVVSTANCMRPTTTVDVKCGDPNKDVPAVITYVGDAVAVIGYGNSQTPCKFQEDISTASFKLKVYYKNKSKCRFTQTIPSRSVYGIKVESRILHELFEGGDDEKFLIQCSFMRYKSNILVNVPLLEKYKPAEMIVIPRGTVAKSTFQIYMVAAISNKRIPGPVKVHSLVRLHSHMTRKNKEVGYMPLECLVESADGKIKILVLASGCGTGFPWRKNQGFTMNGPNGDSPTFRMFRVAKKQGILFRCSFIVCQGACNQNSCPAANKRGRRRRRSVDGLHYNALGLLDERSKGIVTSAIQVQIPKDKDEVMLKTSQMMVYVAILIVTGIMLATTAVVTVFVISRSRRQGIVSVRADSK